MAARGWRVRRSGEVGKRAHIFHYKMSKVWRSTVQHGDCSWEPCVTSLKCAERVGLHLTVDPFYADVAIMSVFLII